MINKAMNWAVMGIAVFLMATYLFLNGYKLSAFVDHWADINAGSSAAVARLELEGHEVYQLRLKTSDIFDASGKRQVVIMPVPKDIFMKIGEQPEAARLIIEQQNVSLSSLAGKTAWIAVTKTRRIYLVANDTLKPMMTVIWNEQRQRKGLIRCMSPDLCKSMNISSREWGPMEGPYSDSDFSAARRGMPRGRWVRGPKTLLTIQSGAQQKVRMQINFLAVNPDQEISFRGAATQVQKLDTKTDARTIGGRSLYPATYIVMLDLQAGANGLEMNYSTWDQPGSEGGNPLAAFVTAIGVDYMSRPAQQSD